MQRTASIVGVALAAVLGLATVVHAQTVFSLESGGVITVTKTVAAGAECAPSPSQVGITVAPGTGVLYCYTIEASAHVTMTLQELEDDKLGILVGPNAHIVILPNTLREDTKSATIFQTTINDATWTVDITDTTKGTDTFGGIVSGAATFSQSLGPVTARVSVPTAAKAPTLSGAGLALVALLLLMVGGLQLSRGGRRSANRS
jgi:hypothetical protein